LAKAQSQKLVVWFSNSKKGLALNRTNNRAIRGAFGDDTAGWTGKLITLFPTQADFRGRLVAALRVRIPPKENPKVSTGPQAKSAVKSAAKPTPAPEPEPDEDLDLDDEIGF
jgi:hypothetical protein